MTKTQINYLEKRIATTIHETLFKALGEPPRLPPAEQILLGVGNDELGAILRRHIESTGFDIRDMLAETKLAQQTQQAFLRANAKYSETSGKLRQRLTQKGRKITDKCMFDEDFDVEKALASLTKV